MLILDPMIESALFGIVGLLKVDYDLCVNRKNPYYRIFIKRLRIYISIRMKELRRISLW